MEAADKGLLFVEFLAAVNTVFANYMTLVFAMLTASWFLAGRMSGVIATCFLILYTLAAVAIGSGVVFGFSDFFALQSYIHETSAPDGDLRWLGPVSIGSEPPEAFMNIFVTAVVVLSWAGSLVFFFIVRKEKQQ